MKFIKERYSALHNFSCLWEKMSFHDLNSTLSLSLHLCPPVLRVGSELRRAGEDPVYSDQALYRCTLPGAGWLGGENRRAGPGFIEENR